MVLLHVVAQSSLVNVTLRADVALERVTDVVVANSRVEETLVARTEAKGDCFDTSRWFLLQIRLKHLGAAGGGFLLRFFC